MCDSDPSIFPEYWIHDMSLLTKCSRSGTYEYDVHETTNSLLKNQISCRFYSAMRLPLIPKFVNTAMTLYQNKERYLQYVIQRDMVIKGNPNECFLFHGTKLANCESIIEQGFNRSFCGKNATAFGKGVYFSNEVNIPLMKTYSPEDDNGIKCVFMARVALGRTYTTPQEGFLAGNGQPPLTSDESYRYDSTGNQLPDRSSNIFVIYNDNQAIVDSLIKCDMIKLKYFLSNLLVFGIGLEGARDIVLNEYVPELYDENGKCKYKDGEMTKHFGYVEKADVISSSFRETMPDSGAQVVSVRHMTRLVVNLLGFFPESVYFKVFSHEVASILKDGLGRSFDKWREFLAMIWNGPVKPSVPVVAETFGFTFYSRSSGSSALSGTSALSGSLPAAGLSGTSAKAQAAASITSTVVTTLATSTQAAKVPDKPVHSNIAWVYEKKQPNFVFFFKNVFPTDTMKPVDFVGMYEPRLTKSQHKYLMTFPHFNYGRYETAVPSPLTYVQVKHQTHFRGLFYANFPLGLELASESLECKNKPMVIPYFVCSWRLSSDVEQYPGYTFVNDGPLGRGYYLDVLIDMDDPDFKKLHEKGDSYNGSRLAGRVVKPDATVKHALEKLEKDMLTVPVYNSIEHDAKIHRLAGNTYVKTMVEYDGWSNYHLNLSCIVSSYKNSMSCLSIGIDSDFYYANFPVGVKKIAPIFKEKRRDVLYVLAFAPVQVSPQKPCAYGGYTFRESGPLGKGYYIDLKRDHDDSDFRVWSGSMRKHLVRGNSAEYVAGGRCIRPGEGDFSWARFVESSGTSGVPAAAGGAGGAAGGSGGVPGVRGVPATGGTAGRKRNWSTISSDNE